MAKHKRTIDPYAKALWKYSTMSVEPLPEGPHTETVITIPNIPGSKGPMRISITGPGNSEPSERVKSLGLPMAEEALLETELHERLARMVMLGVRMSASQQNKDVDIKRLKLSGMSFRERMQTDDGANKLKMLFTDEEPVKCARNLTNKQVMTYYLSAVVFQSSALHRITEGALLGEVKPEGLRPASHLRHPYTLWLSEDFNNYHWGLDYCRALFEERIRRGYGMQDKFVKQMQELERFSRAHCKDPWKCPSEFPHLPLFENPTDPVENSRKFLSDSWEKSVMQPVWEGIGGPAWYKPEKWKKFHESSNGGSFRYPMIKGKTFEEMEDILKGPLGCRRLAKKYNTSSPTINRVRQDARDKGIIPNLSFEERKRLSKLEKEEMIRTGEL